MEIGLLTLGDHLPDPHTGQRTSAVARHRSLVDQAVAAEAAGFARVHVGEHHFCDYIVSAPPVVLAAMAERTERLRLSTGVTLLANLDPVRVAEDYATVDVLSNGRVEMVTGRGSAYAHTFAPFGQDVHDSRSVYDENVELLVRLWSETGVTWTGQHRAPLVDVTVQPRPVQAPHPPIWVGGGSTFDSVDLAARLGLPLMLPSVFSPPQHFVRIVEHYESAWDAAKFPIEQRQLGAVLHCHVAPTSQEARERWEPHLRTYFEWVGDLVRWSQRLAADVSLFGAFDFGKLTSNLAVAGSPAEVVDRIGELASMLHLDQVGLMLDMGGIPTETVLEMIELIGTDVIPNVCPR